MSSSYRAEILYTHKKTTPKLGMADAHNPSTQKAEVGGLLPALIQPGLCSKVLAQK